MKRSALKRKSPLQRGSPRLQTRTRLKTSGAVKAKRRKRQRNHYASKYWKTVRYLVYQRDEGHCRDCGIELAFEEMEGAHITNSRFGKEHLDDVKTSCHACNQQERASRSWYAGRPY